MKFGVLVPISAQNCKMTEIAISDLKIVKNWLNFPKITQTSKDFTEASFCPIDFGKKREVFSHKKISVADRNFCVRNFYTVASQCW